MLLATDLDRGLSFSTVKKAVLSLGLARSSARLLSLALSTLPLTTCTALSLVVLRQLSRVNLVLLELASGLWARWLRWGSFLGLEVGVRHACAC